MKQPTASTIYPELSAEDSTPQNYRLQKISEIEKELKREREIERERESRKKDFVQEV